MPYDEEDETDPMLLVGVELTADSSAAELAASAIAEEYARMGHSEEQLMALFANPFYGGAHQTYVSLGATRIREIVKEQTGFWGRVRFVDRDTEATSGMRLLNVIDGEGRVHCE